MANLVFNKSGFERGLSRGLSLFAQDLNSFLRDAIESPLYPWPGFTQRRSGERVGSPRNIVDLGEFRDSQQYSFPSPLTILFEWTAEHSVLVFAGFTTRAGNTYPPRNPVLQVVNTVDLAGALASRLREVF